MQAARRLYLYVMCGITLGVVASGMTMLLRVALAPFFPVPEYGGVGDGREQLSQAIAFLAVGTPIWTIHWWLIQRGTRSVRPGAAAERGSALRALYFTFVLVISLSAWFISALQFGRWCISTLLGDSPSYIDPLGPVTLAVVTFGIWLYHGVARRRDMAVPVTGEAAWLPRTYLYGVVVLAAFVALGNVTAIVTSTINQLAVDGQTSFDDLVDLGAAALAWAALWYGHWRYAARLVADTGWRGASERVSRVRVAAFLTLIVGTAAATLEHISGAVSSVLAPALVASPENGPERFGVEGLAASLVAGAIWLLAWRWHARAFRREQDAEPHRSVHQARLLSFGLSGLALAMGAVALGWLVGYAIDIALGGVRSHADGYGYGAYELGRWLSLAAVGLPAWVLYWRQALARRGRDVEGEATSTIRRTYLFLVLGSALLVVISTASVIVYRLVGVLLGTNAGGSVVSDLSTPAGALVVALAVLLYHGTALRADQRVTEAGKAAAEAALTPVGTPAPDGPSAPAGTGASWQLLLTGPTGADLQSTLAAIRASLPEGFQLAEPDA